jgi:aminoglycoside 6'-N-acetyltransferase
MCLLVHDAHLAIRLMRDNLADYQILSAWLTNPRVLEFYKGRDRPLSLEDVQSHYGPRIRGAEDVTPCFILSQSMPIGYMQFYRLTEESRTSYALPLDYSVNSAYGIDQFIGEASLWNRGIGTRSISLLLRYLFQTRNARKVVLDPHVSNLRAIRCYEKCGFRKVRLLPAHELHEGIRRDSWLMEAILAPIPIRS